MSKLYKPSTAKRDETENRFIRAGGKISGCDTEIRPWPSLLVKPLWLIFVTDFQVGDVSLDRNYRLSKNNHRVNET